MGQFELKLLNAGEAEKEENEQSPRVKDNKKPEETTKIEIQTEYLYYKQEVASKSVAGLNIHQLTLTKRKGAQGVPFHKRKVMYISSRLHSAETHGSVIMQHLIKELTERAECYDTILSNYIIKLVPMINPDGVTIGNSRSSLVGLDLNRRWAEPNASIHPEIYSLKQVMQQ